MTIIDAIRQCSDGDWIRPVDYRGTGQAFTVRGIHLYAVPSSNGHRLATISGVHILTCEWEIVNPNEVNLERL